MRPLSVANRFVCNELIISTVTMDFRRFPPNAFIDTAKRVSLTITSSEKEVYVTSCDDRIDDSLGVQLTAIIHGGQ